MKGKRAKPTSSFVLGNRVVVHLNGEAFRGVFKGESQKSPGRFKVRVDPEGSEPDYLIKVKLNQISHQPCKTPGCSNHATAMDLLCNDCRREKAEEKRNGDKDRISAEKKGGQELAAFKATGVKWKNEQSFFRLETSAGVRFYGWYRKTRQRNSSGMAHCFDVYCKRLQPDGKELEVAVDSLVYLDTDPRQNLAALNSDIVALANRWYFQRLNGKADTLDQVVAKAEKPTIKITQLRTIDSLILRMKEFRDTAIRCGGERIFELKGDNNNPPVTIIINVSAQAYALKGKAPSLYKGAIYDAARGSGKKGGERTTALIASAQSSNVKDLIKALQSAKEAGNKSEARKIRAVLRSMGHRGGSRLKGE